MNKTKDKMNSVMKKMSTKVIEILSKDKTLTVVPTSLETRGRLVLADGQFKTTNNKEESVKEFLQRIHQGDFLCLPDNHNKIKRKPTVENR